MSNGVINDIASLIGSGITPLRSNKKYWETPLYPWLKTEQLGEFRIFDTSEYISQFALDETSTRLWPPKTLSVAMYGEGQTRGNTSIIMREMSTNQACCNIIIDESKADYRYVYYWLKNSYLQLRILASGVRKNLNSDDIKSFPINYPSVLLQTRIADVLFRLDEKIALNKRINAELEAMAKTIYDYWFMQFDFPDENGKPYRTSGGAMEWNEQLKQENPKGWDAKKIEALLAKVQNTSRIQTDGYDKVGSIPVIDQSTDFIAGYTDEKDAVISTDEGAIVFGDHTRIVKYIGFDFARGADGTQVLLSNNERMPQLLFYYTILKIDLSNYGYARHFKYLKDTFIILPDIKQAKAFHATISPLQRTITHNIKENVELTALRDWLLPMLMNGQATVE